MDLVRLHLMNKNDELINFIDSPDSKLIIKMRNAIILMLVMQFGVNGLQLLIPDKIIVKGTYKLLVHGNNGQVRYEVVALPQGMLLQAQHLVTKHADAGQYLSKVKVIDSSRTEEKVVIIIIQENTHEMTNKQSIIDNIVNLLNKHIQDANQLESSQSLLQAEEELENGLKQLMQIARAATISKNQFQLNIRSLEEMLSELNRELSVLRSQQIQIEQTVSAILNSIHSNKEKINLLEQKLRQSGTNELQMLGIALELAQQSLKNIVNDMQNNHQVLTQFAELRGLKEKECDDIRKEHIQQSQILLLKSRSYSILSSHIQSAAEEVQQNTEAVEKLKKQLKLAQSKLSTAMHILNYLHQEENSLLHQINDGNYTVTYLRQNHTQCLEIKAEIEEKVQLMQQQVNEGLRIKKKQMEKQIMRIKESLLHIEKFGQSHPSEHDQLQEQLQKVKQINEKLEKKERSLAMRSKEVKTNVSLILEKIKVGKQNMIKYLGMYEKESSIQDKATQEFKHFTGEKEKLDDKIEEKSLPYKINQDGSYKVEEWRIYLEELYGFPTTQVPIKIQITALYLQSSSVCQMEQNIQFVGYVIQIFPDKLHIITNRGKYYLLFLTSCTTSFSNVRSYFPTMGDMLVGKGHHQNQRIQASHLTFIRQ